MGRVSRHKKIKPCDPFHRGPKQLVDNSCNIPVQELDVDNQPVPRKVNALFRAKQKRKKGKDVFAQKKPCIAKDNLLRKIGEGKQEYFQRLDKQAAEEIAAIMSKKKNVSQKRKEFLKARKKKKNKKGIPQDFSMEFRKDQFTFGEVVHEPPKLMTKPRHADAKVKQDLSKSKRKVESLLLNHKLEDTKHNQEKQNKTAESSIKCKRRKHMSAFEQQKADQMRSEAIQAYRNLKIGVVSKHQEGS